MISQFGRQKIDGTEVARVYHTRTLLGPKRLPVILGSVHELTGILFLREQGSLMERGASASKDVQVRLLEAALAGNEDVPVHPIVELVREQAGVEFVAVFGYSLIVIRGRQFSWDELEPGILRAFGTFEMQLPVCE